MPSRWFGFWSDTCQLGLQRLFLLLRLTSPTSSRNSCVSVSENEPRGSFLYQEETWRPTPRRSDSICPASTPAFANSSQVYDATDFTGD
ncbi:hypothetical protein ACFX13_002519 [Malus domestica]